MKTIKREDIHILAKHSKLSEPQIDRALKNEVFHDEADWSNFLKYALLALGIGFFAAGVIFFFAYNWDELDKFAKLALTQIIVIIICVLALLPKLNPTTRKILLTGASLLVGVMFSVFGQIYQTGANAYDFFLAWTLFIGIWVLISNFPPLWLLFLGLINTTLILYSVQVAKHWDDSLIFSILFVVNLIPLVFTHLLNQSPIKISIPTYFSNIVALAALTFATIGNIVCIYDSSTGFQFIPVLTTVFYGIGIGYGIKHRSIFYLSAIPLSIIIILSALLLEKLGWEESYLLVSLFILLSVSAVIYNLVNMLKQKRNER
ncbi:DUF2157 domain-containing protein [Sphingobacterium sp. DK4209]|uniref:DUF2157 domain-containing protein n=1 Tax=Sphingobacterium zhuxiongii TaxID=2662364 RepID=A0A5Q0QDS3_9SPHI|nr:MULTISPECIES: DUF2157 domain-containing protein [unclassified Sphingobacterium]MVZ65548.1 DUF2157 domain-containing protein [Sphingobacterium sp. DK4209]QGA27673.1 DUF2157 domain-containing protein [Sphingobacterium sp. dk4302]